MGKSILSEMSVRSNGARATGKIRVGTKRLTKAALKNETAVEIYNAGVEALVRASDIEDQIKKKCGIELPMYPVNTAHFHVSTRDFSIPELARAILVKYGEDRGEGLKLYRFPVMFHSDRLDDFLPHAFECNVGEVKLRSAYNEEGVRVCTSLPRIDKDEFKRQRAAGVKRMPRREWISTRPCVPSECRQFQTKQCKFRGRLQFYIPGVPGLQLNEMETSSEYAAAGIWEELDRIHSALGFIPRSHPKIPGRPIFLITKVQEERAYLDDDGVSRVGLQWVPRLVADIDMGLLMTMASPTTPQIAPPEKWLATPSAPVESHVASQHAEHPVETFDEVINQSKIDTALFSRYAEHKFGPDWRTSQEHGASVMETIEQLAKRGAHANLILESRLLPISYGIDKEVFLQYTQQRFGSGWMRSVETMREVLVHFSEIFKASRASGVTVIREFLAQASDD